MITSNQELQAVLQRGGGEPIELGPGDFDLYPSSLGPNGIPSGLLTGSGVGNTRLHLRDWVALQWETYISHLNIIGDKGFDLTYAPYTKFNDVVFDSSVAQGQSHVGKDWSTVVTAGSAIRIGADRGGRGNDNTYRIKFQDVTFNFFDYPLDLQSSEWVAAMTLDGVTVNGAKIGLFSPSIRLNARATNFQCCKFGMVIAGNDCVGAQMHFERNEMDFILGEHSYGNNFHFDALHYDNLTTVVPPQFLSNRLRSHRGLNMARENTERKAAMLAWRVGK